MLNSDDVNKKSWRLFGLNSLSLYKLFNSDMPPKKKTKTTAEDNPPADAAKTVAPAKPAQPAPAEEKKDTPAKVEKKPSAPTTQNTQAVQEPITAAKVQ